MQELWVLRSACRLMFIDIHIEFREAILNGFQGLDWIRLFFFVFLFFFVVCFFFLFIVFFLFIFFLFIHFLFFFFLWQTKFRGKEKV